MAIDPSVVINLAAEFTGKKAFKQADTATNKLMKSAKSLAKAFGVAYGTSAIIAYGKASVKAFSEDQAAALRLSRAVENLGIGFANPAIADYIGKLEKSAAIADDVLRPAFQGLLTTTGSLTQSQELLTKAITISRASGIDLATVTQDLAKGYVGITKGLTKYNTGLTKSELQSKSFSDILSILLKRSAGAAEDYLGSVSYKLDSLGIATSNASEIIGGGLVDAFALIAGGTEASDATTAIELFAKAVAKIEVGTGTAIGAIPNLLKNLKNLPKQIFFGFAGKQTGVNINPTPTPKTKPLAETPTAKKQRELLAALEASAAKRQREILALQKKSTKSIQDQLKLNKAAAIFDIKRIQIAAALKGQISAEERIRLELMMAVEDGNAAKADELTKKLAAAQANTEKLATTISTLPAANDPFVGFNAGALGSIMNIEALKAKVTELTGVALSSNVAMSSFAQGITAGLSTAQSIAGARYAAQAAGAAGLTDLMPGASAPNFPVAFGLTGPAFPTANTGGGSTTVYVNFTGVVTDPIGTANQLNQVLAQSANSVGTTTGLGSGYKNVTYIV